MTLRLNGALLCSLIIAIGSSSLRADDRHDGARANDCCNAGPGAVYLMTNQPANAIMVFNRSAGGILTPGGTFLTGGAGGQSPSGNPFDPLASQGSLLLGPNQHLLFAVNAGSNEISVLSVGPNGLTLADKVSSGGQTPVSLTLHGDILYVLNAGGVANITGFTVADGGKLSPLPGSTRSLPGGAAAAPAQVGFSPDGDLLVVSEKGTNMLEVYRVSHNGLTSGPAAQNSNGMTPFGFAFARPDILIVSEAFGGAPMQAAVSSYRLPESGNLRVISGSVPDHQTAACWVVTFGRGQYAYVTNTGSGAISGYSVADNGSLTLLNPDGVTAATGPGTNPIDMALTGSFLYVILNGPNGRRIVGYHVESNGALTGITSVGGLPIGVQGIAAR
jgi:6-phosphogluconolactonase